MLLSIAGLTLTIVMVLLIRPLLTKAGRARLARRRWFVRFVDVFVDGLISAVVGIVFNVILSAIFGGDDDKPRATSSRRGTFDGGGASGDW